MVSTPVFYMYDDAAAPTGHYLRGVRAGLVKIK